MNQPKHCRSVSHLLILKWEIFLVTSLMIACCGIFFQVRQEKEALLSFDLLDKSFAEISFDRVSNPNVHSFNFPLSFEKNEGQSDGNVQYISKGLGYTMLLKNQEMMLSFSKKSGETFSSTSFNIAFVDANPTVKVRGVGEQ